MKRRSFKQDKIAKVYDTEILPIWAKKFGRLLLKSVQVPPRAMVLNVACSTGYPAMELLQKMDQGSRIIAIESSGPLLDIARNKAGDLSGRQIFFRTEHISEKLSFADDVYDVTFTNLGLDEFEIHPEEVIKDFARVTQPGGQVLVTMPMRGSWEEFFDIYREVLVKQDNNEILNNLEEYIESFPEPQTAVQWMHNAGLKDVQLVEEKFSLLFKSAREFFFAPIIEYGPLRTWKALAGKGQEMQDIFWYIKEAIEAYFSNTAFSVSVVAGCVYGFKPTEEELLEEEHLQPGEVKDPSKQIDLEATLLGTDDDDDDDDDDEKPSGAFQEWSPEEDGFSYVDVVDAVEDVDDADDVDVWDDVDDVDNAISKIPGPDVPDAGIFDERTPDMSALGSRVRGEDFFDVAEELDPDDLEEISPEPEEEDTDLDNDMESAITDPRRTPLPKKTTPGESPSIFGGDAEVATTHDEDEFSSGGEVREDRRPSLEELEAAFDAIDGSGSQPHKIEDSENDPFAEIRVRTAEISMDEDSLKGENPQSLSVQDIEEIDDIREIRKDEDIGEPGEAGDESGFPASGEYPLDGKAGFGPDEEDLPTMESFRGKKSRAEDSGYRDERPTQEEIDPDDIPTKDPNRPGSYHPKDRGNDR